MSKKFICLSPMTGTVLNPKNKKRPEKICFRAGDEIRRKKNGDYMKTTMRTVSFFPPTLEGTTVIFSLASNDQRYLEAIS